MKRILTSLIAAASLYAHAEEPKHFDVIYNPKNIPVSRVNPPNYKHIPQDISLQEAREQIDNPELAEKWVLERMTKVPEDPNNITNYSATEAFDNRIKNCQSIANLICYLIENDDVDGDGKGDTKPFQLRYVDIGETTVEKNHTDHSETFIKVPGKNGPVYKGLGEFSPDEEYSDLADLIYATVDRLEEHTGRTFEMAFPYDHNDSYGAFEWRFSKEPLPSLLEPSAYDIKHKTL